MLFSQGSFRILAAQAHFCLFDVSVLVNKQKQDRWSLWSPRPLLTDVGTETAFRLDQRKHFRKSKHLLRSEVS